MMGDSSAQGEGMCGGEGNWIWIPLLGNPSSVLSSAPQTKQGESLPSSAPGQDPWQNTATFISGIDTKHITNLLPLAALRILFLA